MNLQRRLIAAIAATLGSVSSFFHVKKLLSHTLCFQTAVRTIHKDFPMFSIHARHLSIHHHYSDHALHTFLNPSKHLLQKLPKVFPLSLFESSTRVVIRSSIIRSTRPNYFKPLRTTLSLSFHTPAPCLRTSFLSLFTRATPHITHLI